MTTCAKCGQVNPDGASYCNKCASALQVASVPELKGNLGTTNKMLITVVSIGVVAMVILAAFVALPLITHTVTTTTTTTQTYTPSLYSCYDEAWASATSSWQIIHYFYSTVNLNGDSETANGQSVFQIVCT